MKKLKTFLAGLIALALIVPAAPVQAGEVQSGHIAYYWDADSDTITFPLLLGRDDTIFGGGRDGGAPVSASASTTLAATTASTSPFAFVAVGDVIEIRVDNTTHLRVVTVRTDADTVTVNAAITVTAAHFKYYKLVVGTAATAGWFDVSGADSVTFMIQPVNIAVDAGGVDVRVECKGGHLGAEPVQVHPAYTAGSAATVTNLSAEGLADYVYFNHTSDWASCRVGFIVTDDDATDTTTAAEEIIVGVTIRRSNR